MLIHPCIITIKARAAGNKSSCHAKVAVDILSQNEYSDFNRYINSNAASLNIRLRKGRRRKMHSSLHTGFCEHQFLPNTPTSSYLVREQVHPDGAQLIHTPRQNGVSVAQDHGIISMRHSIDIAYTASSLTRNAASSDSPNIATGCPDQDNDSALDILLDFDRY